MERLAMIIYRVFFIVAFVFVGLAIWEKLANLFGFTLTFLNYYTPWRLLEFAAIVLLFVIALQLRVLKMAIRGKSSN